MHKKIIPFIISFVIIFSPMFVLGAKESGLVPKCNTVIDVKNGGFVDPCDFNNVMVLINTIIDYFIKFLATPIFAILFIYAGFIYITAGGDSGKTKLAKKIITNSVLGYLIALAGWLIVDTILKGLGFTGPNYLTN